MHCLNCCKNWDRYTHAEVVRNVDAAKWRICSDCVKAGANWIQHLNASSSNLEVNAHRGDGGRHGLPTVSQRLDKDPDDPVICDWVIAAYDGIEPSSAEAYLPVEKDVVVEILSRQYPRDPHNNFSSGYVYVRDVDRRTGWVPQAVLAGQPFYKPPPPDAPPPPAVPPPYHGGPVSFPRGIFNYRK